MQNLEHTIRLQALDGTWETVGVDRYRGIAAEAIQLASNAYGSDTASFTLKRDNTALHTDLAAWTPCEVEVGGVLVWSGRVKETPASAAEMSISVQGEGWQYHLDDDAYARSYIHSNLTDWQDYRAFLAADLTTYRTAANVSSGAGVISMGWPSGTVTTATDRVGVMLDLGQADAKRVIFTWDSSNNFAGSTCQVFGADDSALTGVENGTSFAMNSGASGSTATTFTTTHRFILVRVIAAVGTLSQDVFLRLKSIQTFRDTTYESGGVSALKATAIIKDSLAFAPLLASDTSKVDPAGSVVFTIPDFDFGKGPRTVRETWDAANSYHNYQTSVDVYKRPVFRPLPAVPLFEAGSWPGCLFDDASMNSGDEIFNKAIGQGNDPGGLGLIVSRTTGNVGTYPLTASLGQASNPSFDAATTGWTATGATNITRDTGVFNSSPASGRWDKAGAVIPNVLGPTLTFATTGTFLANVTYTMTWMERVDTAGGRLTVTINGVDLGINFTVAAANTWTQMSLTFTSATNLVAPTFAFAFATNVASKFYFDDIQFTAPQPTLADRRGFSRTKILQVDSTTTAAALSQLCDTFLGAHKTTPFKGSLTAFPSNGVRMLLGGAPVHPALLLINTGELMRFSDRVDPDTGNAGRDGRLATVAYSGDTQQSVVAVDSSRDNFAVLLTRLGALSQGLATV